MRHGTYLKTLLSPSIAAGSTFEGTKGDHVSMILIRLTIV